MERALRAALLWIAFVFALPVTGFLLWDSLVFRPHLAEINRILMQADQEDRHLTPTIHRLFDANVSSESAHVGSRLCWRLDPKSGNRHVTHALWALSVKLHFDPDERDALLATLAWNGMDYGLNRYARRAYGRSLSELNDREAAMVVAWTGAPDYYLRNPERLRLRAESLLRQSGAP